MKKILNIILFILSIPFILIMLVFYDFLSGSLPEEKKDQVPDLLGSRGVEEL